MSITIKRFSLLLAFFATTLVIIGQNTGSNSPQGRFGVGVLSLPTLGSSEQMGGISYGLQRNQGVNPGNPASYATSDTLTFIFDFGVSAHSVRMSDGINQRNMMNSNLDFITIQFPLWRGTGGSIGLLPFSKVGYNFGGLRQEANIQFVESYRGTGGLSTLYAGFAWEPLNNLSVGVNIAYLFGNFTHTRVATPREPGSRISEGRFHYALQTVRTNFGVQQTFPLRNARSITIGAVYSPQITMSSDVVELRRLFNVDPWQHPWQHPVEVLSNDTLHNANFQLPHTFGLGFTFTSPRWLFGVDGEVQLWNGIKYNDHIAATNASGINMLDGMTRDNRFNDTFRISTGFEYVRNPFSHLFFHRMRIRGGVSVVNSYTNVNVYDPTSYDFLGLGSFRQYGANIGFGFPVLDFLSGHVSMLNIGFHYTRQQPSHPSMVAQDMFRVSVNINFNELMFFRRLMD